MLSHAHQWLNHFNAGEIVRRLLSLLIGDGLILMTGLDLCYPAFRLNFMFFVQDKVLDRLVLSQV